MADLILGPVLRYVSDTEATVWVETDAACTVRVLDVEEPTWEVAGHHYALVMIEGLAPGSTTPYQVHLDDARRWPEPSSRLPPSTIRTTDDRPRQMLFGSCRAAGPHEKPYILESDDADEGLGVDALRANGLRMLGEPADSWPDVLVFLGDQVYADNASPQAQRRIEAQTDRTAPDDVVGGFEEYTWLYHEAWRPEIERWVMSTVPSVMIFDDHDVIDDWNTSAAWVADIRSEPWWQEHIVGAMMSYWIYQHLGNLSPTEIRREGVLARVRQSDDAEAVLRSWALASETQTPVPGGYRFSFDRWFGDVHLVMVDVRNGRVLTEDRRRIVGEREWEWITDRCREPCRHLVITTSLPVFVPGGVHALQQWDEAICQGRWGRVGTWAGERIRRAIDTEHWPGFDTSFREFEQLLLDVGCGDSAPETITVLGGDIHFSYAVRVDGRDGTTLDSRVHQVVSSPIRNILGAPERRAMRFAQSSTGRRIAEFLQRRVGRPPSRLTWDLDVDPIFDNTMAQLRFDGGRVCVEMERSRLTDGREWLEVFQELEL